MKIISSLTLSILIISSTLSAQEVVRLTNGDWPPYLSQILPHYGLASHIISEAFAASGIKVEYGFFPWKRSYNYAKEGTDSVNIWNGSVVWVYNPTRALDFYYSDAVIIDSDVLYHLKSNALNWSKLQDLEGRVIGGTLHTAYPRLDKAEKEGILTMERAGNYKELFKRLLGHRIDAIPNVSKVGEYYLRTQLRPAEKNKITFSPTILHKKEYKVILNKKIPENTGLIKRLNEGLKIIKSNGTYQRLLNDLDKGNYDR